MTYRIVPLALTAILFSLPARAAAPLLTPGRWEITIQTVSPVAMPPMTHEVCISKEDAQRSPEPPKGKKSDDCKSTGSLHGNSLKYATKCGRKKVSSTTEYTYMGDRFEGVVIIQADGQEIRQIQSGKWVGECEIPEE